MPANSVPSLLSEEEIEEQIDALEEDTSPNRSLEEWANTLYQLAPDEFWSPRKRGRKVDGLPGSDKKIDALRNRVLNHESLWNPRDAIYKIVAEAVIQPLESLGNGHGFKLPMKLGTVTTANPKAPVS